MRAEEVNIGEILGRLQQLERSNRRLKRGAMAVLAVLGTVMLMGAAGSVPRTVKAQQFILVDPQGRVRASFDTTEQGSEIRLFDANGKFGSALNVGTVGTSLSFGCVRAGGVDSGPCAPRLTLGVLSGVPELLMLDANANMEAGMNVTSDGPNVSLWDRDGFETTIGSTALETPTTGERRRTSAASIVMFGNDKDHTVIWRAPN